MHQTGKVENYHHKKSYKCNVSDSVNLNETFLYSAHQFRTEKVICWQYATPKNYFVFMCIMICSVKVKPAMKFQAAIRVILLQDTADSPLHMLWS